MSAGSRVDEEGSRTRSGATSSAPPPGAPARRSPRPRYLCQAAALAAALASLLAGDALFAPLHEPTA